MLDDVAWLASSGHLRPVGDEAGRSWEDWNADLAPRLDAPEGGREARYNPNHDPHSGKFSNAKGTGAGGLAHPGRHVFPEHPTLHPDLHGVKAAADRAVEGTGISVHVASGKPLNPSDATAAKRAAESGKTSVRITSVPQAEAHRDGGLTSYRVGGKVTASVQADATGREWAVHEHGHNGRYDPDAPARVYASREKAEANAEKLVRSAQKWGAGSHWFRARDHAHAADLVSDYLGGDRGTSRHNVGLPDKHDAFVYVIHPGSD